MRSTIRIAAAACAAMVAAAVACLPDLEVVQAPAAVTVCGDGRIDPDAGEECDPGSGPAPGCAGCRVACDGGAVDDASLHCYFGAPQATQKSEADTARCGAAGAHVVTFASERELAFVAGNAQVAAASPFWVDLVFNAGSGAYEPSIPFEPGWTRACAGCFVHGDAGSATLPPRAPKATGPCVISDKTTASSWYQSACNGVSWYVVCEREPLGSRAQFCGGAVCITIPRTAKRYVYVPERVSASDAALACSTQFHGALVRFDSPEEREQLAREIAIQTVVNVGASPEFWIGLSNGDAGSWVWDDNQARPQPWGLNAGAPEPAGSPPIARAFVRIQTGAVDSELAHAGSAAPDGGDAKPFVCEY